MAIQGSALKKYILEHDIISQDKLVDILEEAKGHNEDLETALVRRGLFSLEDLYTILADINNVPYVDLSNYLIDKSILKLIPRELAERNTLIPLFKIGNCLTVSMMDPADIRILDLLRQTSGCDIDPCVSSPQDIKHAIREYYGVEGAIDSLIGTLDEEIKSFDKKDAFVPDHDKSSVAVAGEAPIVKLVNMTIIQAVHSGASDIHFEPEEKFLRVRFRVGGILRDAAFPPKQAQSAILTRIKVQAQMDISEVRLPQDGRFQVRVDDRQIDIRVSSVPTTYGENIVLRLLDVSGVLIGLEGLGFNKGVLDKFEKLIQYPHGIILVTGPTGSGKTTTLYSSLHTINSKEKNIITIEDPVEYRLELVRQIQINPKAGLTFATGLRSIMRQDPDIIMVGEIRDVETARLATQASLTGHLVFSTLHTNDAPSSVTRLIDMGVEPFLISSTIRCVVAQRLVRTLCEKCKEPYTPSPDILNTLGIQNKREVTFYKQKGCDRCHGQGYKGRIGIFELMEVNDELRNIIMNHGDARHLKQCAEENGMKDLSEDGVQKLLQGVTSVEEVYRVTQSEIS